LRQKAAMVWRFVVEAPYLTEGSPTCDATALVDLWPHQRHVVEEAAAAWPEGRLLCDEVGMGKTIEAILVLRRLMAGRGVRRALLLLPAGLLRQWQGELREKGGMMVPRLDGPTTLVWPDDRVERIEGLSEALRQDVLLMSRETARTEGNLQVLLATEPWDLVLLDEAHAARRRKQEEGEFNGATLLLDVLRQLQLRGRTKGILLLSATPMQTHPWEPWDLLAVLGEGGAWLADFDNVRTFYRAISAVGHGSCEPETAKRAATLIVSDTNFPSLGDSDERPTELEKVANVLRFAPPTKRAAMAAWMRQGSPLARRMHRNTRNTLREYYRLGLLSSPPSGRDVLDIIYDLPERAERDVYDAVGRYIERRFQELEHEKPGKGFVMTIYRRRASSSPLALERSLERRRDGLLRVADRRAYDVDLTGRDVPEAIDAEDLPEGDGAGRVSQALPSDPVIARKELVEVDDVLTTLRSLHGRDTKRERFFDVLRQVSSDGRSVLVFTEYTDTMEYLRDSLVDHYGTSLGCYSGDGGKLWTGTEWNTVTKSVITDALRAAALKVLLCTDAASEGLNLQAAGALINYDLPWNPSRVEQRIGRIDRIGQRYPKLTIVNLYLKDSVDDKVYRALRTRCGLFEHFVGAMQPVLSRARKMLTGQEPLDLAELAQAASASKDDPLQQGTYVENTPFDKPVEAPPLSRSDLEMALHYLSNDIGYLVKQNAKTGAWIVQGPEYPKVILGQRPEILEADHAIEPLSPLSPRLRRLVEGLLRPGERLPLVVESVRKDGFRCTEALWLGEGTTTRITRFVQLQNLVESWNGDYPDPSSWQQAVASARRHCQNEIATMERQAQLRCEAGLARQRDSARLRLLQELGRFLACQDGGPSDLNGAFHRGMLRDVAGAQRLKRCFERLGSYPNWDAELCRRLEEFVADLSDNQRKARLLGKELDAALDDPRWAVATSTS
jgi:superfamily II DNA or RNA helicase